MSTWLVVGGIASGVLGAGASIYGANRNADAIEGGTDSAAQVQQNALSAALALQRPQQEVGLSALATLANLFGLEPPSAVDFDGIQAQAGGGVGRSGVFTPGSALSASQQAAVNDVTRRFGFDPSANPDAFLGLDQTTIPKKFRDSLNNFKAQFGYDPTVRERNPFFDDGVVSNQTADRVQGADFSSLTDLVENNPLTRFNIEQGEQAITRAAAARGLNESGRTIQDLVRFNTDQTTAATQNLVLNPLFQLAGFGNQAAANSGNAVLSTGNNLSNLALGGAQARGSAFQNAGNTVGNLASDTGNLLLYQALRT